MVICVKAIIKKIKKLLSDKDERNLIINILMAFLVKGLSLIVSLYSMPLYIRYFNNNVVLGVWYTILSILSWISIFDLGMTNGLRNYFTKAYSENDRLNAKKYVTSTYVSLTLIVIPIVIIGSICIPFLDLNSFFKVSSDLIETKSLIISMIILLFGLGANFVLRSITSIIYAIQKSSVNNFISLIISILPLVYILIAPSGTLSNNVIRLSIVHIVAINLPLIVATIILFKTKCKEYNPSLKYFDMNVAKKTLNMGMKFFFAQIFFMFLISTNELFITRIFSPSYVVMYSAYNKIFMLIGSLFMLALTPLWSKVTKDITEKKYIKIKKTNRALYSISAMAVVAEFILILALQWIFDVWLKDSTFDVDIRTALIFALFGGLFIFNIVLTTVANGMGELGTQALFYGVGAALKIPIIIIFKNIYNDWSLVIFYNCIVLLVFCIVQIVWVSKRINKLIKVEEI